MHARALVSMGMFERRASAIFGNATKYGPKSVIGCLKHEKQDIAPTFPC